MKALILNGGRSGDDIVDRLEEIVIKCLDREGWERENILLKDKDVAYCTGCFKCWIEIPGECIIDDPAREITGQIINSDLVVYLTPVVFGGYSYHLKKVLDRSISLVSPFFTQIDGEVHHKKRYDKYPFLVGLGVNHGGNKESAEIFHSLVERNALNLHAPGYESEVFKEDVNLDRIEERINNLIKEAGEVR